MATPETSEVAAEVSSAETQAQNGLRPIMTLLAATLHATSALCACEACALLRLRAKDLVPLVARMSDGEGT